MPEAQEIDLTIADRGLLAPVLERLVSAAAARAELPVNRVVDALTIVDAIVAASDSVLDKDSREVKVRVSEGSLSIVLAGLLDGQAEAILGAADVPSIGNVLERTASSVDVVHVGPHSALVVALN